MAFSAGFGWRGDPALDRKMVRNALTSTYLRGAPLPVEEDEAPDPVDVGLLGADAVVQPANDVAHLIEQPWLAPSRGQIPRSVHAVFPYGGAPAASYSLFCYQSVASLADAPPRYNTASRPPPPQPPTVPQPIPGQDRDEAGAKYLIRRCYTR
jgi:hypothetical protein